MSTPKEELELEQLKLANQKLAVETAKIRQETEPESRLSKLSRKFVSIGGIVTVIATILGLHLSYDKSITERRLSREAQERARLEGAITRLEKKATLSKLVGLSQLSGYLDAKEN